MKQLNQLPTVGPKLFPRFVGWKSSRTKSTRPSHWSPRNWGTWHDPKWARHRVEGLPDWHLSLHNHQVLLTEILNQKKHFKFFPNKKTLQFACFKTTLPFHPKKNNEKINKKNTFLKLAPLSRFFMVFCRTSSCSKFGSGFSGLSHWWETNMPRPTESSKGRTAPSSLVSKNGMFFWIPFLGENFCWLIFHQKKGGFIWWKCVLSWNLDVNWSCSL